MERKNKEHYKVIETTTALEMTETLNGFYEEGYLLMGQVMPMSSQYATYFVATVYLKTDC